MKDKTAVEVDFLELIANVFLKHVGGTAGGATSGFCPGRRQQTHSKEPQFAFRHETQSSNALGCGCPGGQDSAKRHLDGSSVAQRVAPIILGLPQPNWALSSILPSRGPQFF